MSEREKYRQPDAVILRHPEGGVLRLDPARFGAESRQAAQNQGWVEQPPLQDGFRPRRRRTKADMQRLIRDGVVADPSVGGQPHQEYPPDTFVISVPLGQVGGEGRALAGTEE